MATIISSDDFTANALADNSVDVTRIPITKTLTGNGDEILTEGTSEVISVILHKRKPILLSNEQGLEILSDAYIMTGPSQALNRDDKITFGTENYRVINKPIVRGPSGDTVFYKYADMVFLS